MQYKIERGATVDTFRPELVALRRRMLGLSQSELAEKVGLSQGTLSKIEQGLKDVTSDLVRLLAEGLRCSPTFFCQSEREYGPPMSAHPMFRKRSSVGTKVLDRTVAELNVRLAHIRQLMQSIEFDPELPLPSYDADDFGGDAAEIARNLRKAWYVPRGPIRSLTEYAERAGCFVVQCDLSEAQIDGVSYHVPGLPPVVFLNEDRPADRQRFTLAHELGHLIMHRYPNPDMERQADLFASELLMPADDIERDLVGLTLERAAQMKPFWRVSMAALIVRAGSLRSIDEAHSLRLWKQMSAKLYRTREPIQLDFPKETVSLFPALLDNMLNDLGYGPADFEQALHLSYDELSSLYGLPVQAKAQAPKSLRLVS